MFTVRYGLNLGRIKTSSRVPRLASIAPPPDKMHAPHRRDRFPPTCSLSPCVSSGIYEGRSLSQRLIPSTRVTCYFSLHLLRFLSLASWLAIATGRRLTLNQTALKTFLGTYTNYIHRYYSKQKKNRFLLA